MSISVSFGKVIRRLRLEKGFSQEQLGFEADLRRTYISIIELGQQQPSLSTIFKLANALQIPASTLINHVEQEISLNDDLSV